MNRHDDSIRAYCLRYDEPLPWEPFVGWIRTLIATHGEKLLRIKGIVNVAGQDKPIAIHGVQHLFHDPAQLPEWPDGDTRSRIVFITQDLRAGDRRTAPGRHEGGNGEGELGKRPMRKPGSMRALEELGRVRLSPSFFMRDFLYSEIAAFYGLANIPDEPDLAIAAGTRLCETLLEPLREDLRDRVGPLRVPLGRGQRLRQSERSQLRLQRSEPMQAHIWDRRDADGCMGATACIVIPWFADRYAETGDWRPLAWFVHDHLPYSRLCFFPEARRLQHPVARAPGAADRQLRERPRAASPGRECRASRTTTRRATPDSRPSGSNRQAAFRSLSRSCGRWRSISGPSGTMPVGLMCFMSA